MADGFEIEPVFGLSTLRVLHADAGPLAVALIDRERDGSLVLFPVKFDAPPAPLTGNPQTFPDLGAVKAFLGLTDGAAA